MYSKVESSPATLPDIPAYMDPMAYPESCSKLTILAHMSRMIVPEELKTVILLGYVITRIIKVIVMTEYLMARTNIISIVVSENMNPRVPKSTHAQVEYKTHSQSKLVKIEKIMLGIF